MRQRRLGGEKTRTLRHRIRLTLEALEDRTLLDAGQPVGIASPYGPDLGWAESRILVQFKSEFCASVASLGGTHLARSFELVPGLYEVQLQPGVTVEEALAAYKADPRVLFAQPDYQIQINATPNDPSFGSLWGLHNTGQSGGTADADIDAPEAWDITKGSPSIIVGVIDTGIDYNHPDLAANMWRNPGEIAGNGLDDDSNGFVDDVFGADFANNDGNPIDDNNHGTHVAGTIGAVGNNGVGVVGVAWNVRLMALKFLSAGGSGYTSDAIEAINYAIAKGAKILNNSWGGGGYDGALYNAIVAAKNSGIIFVAAAGNSGANNDTGAFYPANYNVDNVVSVAATTRTDTLASFSNYGATTVDLAAPGVSILSTTRSNTYSTFSGTSMATPHVAGAFALVWSANPTLTYRQVIDRVLNNVDPLAALSGRVVTGGRLNVSRALGGGGGGGDLTGPRVTTSAWLGATGSINQVRFYFSESIAAGTFTTADVASFTGPSGVNLLGSVTGVSGSGAVWTVSFASQTAPGTYSMTIGPDIRDLAAPANQMDQNGNGIKGEIPADRYTSTHSLNGTYVFTSSDVPKAINDLQTTISVLNVTQNVTIKDINVRFYITHTWDSDLRIRLRAPDGTFLNLVNYRGGSGDNFGSLSTYTTMDDEAATPITAGVAPFVGSYRPESFNELYRLDNKQTLGTWRLEIYDRASLDTGMLRGWQLVVTPQDGGAGGASLGRRTPGGDRASLLSERRAPTSFTALADQPATAGNDADMAIPQESGSHRGNVRVETEVNPRRRRGTAPAADALEELFVGYDPLLRL
jgi:subtilisin family serine protease